MPAYRIPTPTLLDQLVPAWMPSPTAATGQMNAPPLPSGDLAGPDRRGALELATLVEGALASYCPRASAS